jgi:hypothetical protein
MQFTYFGYLSIIAFPLFESYYNVLGFMYPKKIIFTFALILLVMATKFLYEVTNSFME